MYIERLQFFSTIDPFILIFPDEVGVSGKLKIGRPYRIESISRGLLTRIGIRFSNEVSSKRPIECIVQMKPYTESIPLVYQSDIVNFVKIGYNTLNTQTSHMDLAVFGCKIPL